MKPKLIFLTATIVLVALGAFVVTNKDQVKPKSGVVQTGDSKDASSPAAVDININAAFAIYTNGTFRIFTASMYHNLSADVFIESRNPNIVHVKRRGNTWGDFFKTLPMKLTRDCLTTGTGQTFCSSETQTLKFYINGQRVENFLDREINQNDQALITYGSESDSEIKNQLEKVEGFL